MFLTALLTASALAVRHLRRQLRRRCPPRRWVAPKPISRGCASWTSTSTTTATARRSRTCTSPRRISTTGYGFTATRLRSSPKIPPSRSCAADMSKAHSVTPENGAPGHRLFILPAEPWARRVSGLLANEFAQAGPQKAHAILTRLPADGFVVSVRAPLARPKGPGCRVTVLCFPPIQVGQGRPVCRQVLWIGGPSHIRLGALRFARLRDMALRRASPRSAYCLSGPSRPLRQYTRAHACPRLSAFASLSMADSGGCPVSPVLNRGRAEGGSRHQ